MIEVQIVALTPSPGKVKLASGEVVSIPTGWECLAPGDVGLTRRLKALGPNWTVIEKRGRKTFSHGVWAPAGNIELARRQLEVERSTPGYARKRASATARRDAAQVGYTEDFRQAVLDFLAFAHEFAELAGRMADAVTAHATPVGSGTVARTKRIPLAQRAEAAVLAWMRHQTTEYDLLEIPRVRGERRRVRGQLAGASRRVLQEHRVGGNHPKEGCPLCEALPYVNP